MFRFFTTRSPKNTMSRECHPFVHAPLDVLMAREKNSHSALNILLNFTYILTFTADVFTPGTRKRIYKHLACIQLFKYTIEKV